MKRRNVIAGLAAVASAGAAVGSGAFTSVEAERDATVEVVNEQDSAYLQFGPSNEPNNVYVDNTADEKLRLDFNDVTDPSNGFGPNLDAEYEFDDVFLIQNEGTQPVYFWLDDFINTNGEVIIDQFDLYVGDNSDAIVDGDDGVVELPQGEEVSIGAFIDTANETIDDTTSPDKTNTAQIEANADAPSGATIYDKDGNDTGGVGS